MKKIVLCSVGYWGVILTSLLFVVLLISPSQAFASPSVTVLESIANVDVGNQTAVATSTTANVPEVKASSTIAVATIPANGETITIGNCAVTFASSTSVTDSNCVGGATIDFNAVASTTSNIASAILSLTNATSTLHGNLTLAAGGTATSVVVYTTGTEISATPIEFVADGVKIATTTVVSGTVPVAQVETITIGGTAAAGNTFNFFAGSFSTSTTSVLGDTLQTIANKLNTAIQSTAGYGALLFGSATGTNSVILTASTTGTGFTSATTSVSNFTGTAQVVVFTPANTAFNDKYNYNVSINGATSTYVYNSGTIPSLVGQKK